MQLLEQLSPEDQSLLLQYFGLGKTQSQMAGWHCTGQTIVSTGIRMAVRRFGTVLLLGPLNIRTIRSILTASGLEGGLDRPLSTAVRLYSRCRSVVVCGVVPAFLSYLSSLIAPLIPVPSFDCTVS